LVQLSLEPEYALGRGTFLLTSFSFSRTHHHLSQVELVDFGATRSYSPAFMDNWLRLLLAAAQQDREGCLRWSLKLGYLTGEENDVSLSPPLSVLQMVLIDWVIRL
jgi:predicted unusual protein kinase regulating ubiquinone biosynthesis (AarF/ABC1/UbiB family)